MKPGGGRRFATHLPLAAGCCFFRDGAGFSIDGAQSARRMQPDAIEAIRIRWWYNELVMQDAKGDMRLGWLYVAWASIVEVFWVLGLKYSTSWWHWLGTAVAIIFSFYFIIKACEKLPSGTVYAVFTGAGAAMIVALDFLVFDAVFSWGKLLFILLIILGVIGLKMTTDERSHPSDGSKRGE